MNDLEDTSRRGFIKKAGYVVPAILTLGAAPAFAGAGSVPPPPGDLPPPPPPG